MVDREFKLKPSAYYIYVLSLSMLVSFIVIVTWIVSVWLKIILVLSVLLYGSWMFLQVGLLYGSNTIISMKRLADGAWLLRTHATSYKADLRGDSTVTNLVTVLRFQDKRYFFPRSCLIFRDSLPNDDYRRLRVVLRHF